MGFPFTKVLFGVACCVFYHHDSAPKFPSYWLNVRDPKGNTFEQVPIGLKDCDYWASWWLNQPIWNIHIRQIGSFPQVRGKNENIWNHHLVTICSYISCALSTTTGQLAIDFRIKINQVFRYCTSDCEEITVGEWVEFHNFYRWKQIMIISGITWNVADAAWLKKKTSTARRCDVLLNWSISVGLGVE